MTYIKSNIYDDRKNIQIRSECDTVFLCISVKRKSEKQEQVTMQDRELLSSHF